MKVSILIDGKTVQAEKGSFLLGAARRAGIEIPALCSHDALEPYGSCRLCLVEVSRGDRARMTTACNYPIRVEGETVSTDSERVVRARRVVMELILARCPGSDIVRGMAEAMGVTASRFPAPQPTRIPAGDPALVECVLCGLCVRACTDAIGASAISFSDRGPNRRVASPFFVNTDACTGCGACAAVCPTGVIRIEDSQGVRRLPFLAIEVAMIRCVRCGAPFGAGPQVKRLRGEVPAVAESIELCPACRRQLTGSRLARESTRYEGALR